MKSRRITKKNRFAKPYVWWLPALLLVALAAWLLFFRDNKPVQQVSTSQPASGNNYVGNQAASGQDRTAGETPPAKNPIEPKPSSGKTSVSVQVSQPADTTVSSNFTVRASAVGVAENGGTCAAILTSGSTARTFTSKGFLNASSTTCYPIAVKGLTPGSWQLLVSYSSADASGKSVSQALEVK